MTNYMPKVAKMLGVELEEIFEYENLPGIPFKLTETGLVCLGPATMSRDIMNEALVRILIGCTKIKRKPWKPKFEESYYSVGVDGTVENGTWLNDFLDYSLYKIGNCYRTIDEARDNISKWGKFYDSDEILEV